MNRFLSFVCLLLFPAIAGAAEFTVNGRHFTLPDGFTIELVAGPPLVSRPVTADFDEQGRLYVIDSSGSSARPPVQLKELKSRIVRLVDSKGDGIFDQQTVFADHMAFMEGTMWLNGSLYVTAPPVIWKLTDTTGNGVADQRAVWFDAKTVSRCANDLHGPYLGPDGWVYWCKGEFEQQTYTRPGHKPLVTRAAHVFRARPDGAEVEPFITGGMNNPVEVTFTPGGEAFVSSTFLYNPAAGKRDGLFHAVYGGLYPKIHDDVLNSFPHTFPGLMPILTGTGPAAQCGLTRYEGDSFGAQYDGNLFASSFNLHKVTRHILKATGATFDSVDSDFLVCDNVDFHPTHLLEDADGSLLVVDTGGWYHVCCPTSQIGKPDVLGAIYRVRRTGAKPPADPRGLKLNWDKLSSAELCDLLGDPRFAVRQRAESMLAGQGAPALPAISAMLAKSPSVTARLAAAWAAGRDDGGAAIDRALVKDSDESVRQAAAHCLAARRDHDSLSALLELLKNESAPNRRVAAEALGRIGDKAVVPALLAALAQPVDHFLEHSLTYALIEIADGPGTAAGLASDNPRVQRAALMALDQMDPRGPISAEDVARAILASDSALRETAEWIASRHPDWGTAEADALKKRLTDEHLSAADAEALAHELGKLIGSPAVQKVMLDQLESGKSSRQIVLSALGYSNLRSLPPGWATALSNILSVPELVNPTTAALRHLPARAVAPLAGVLMATGKREDLPPDTRIDALATLPTIDPMPADLFAFLTAQLAADVPSARQSLAADVLGHAALSTEQLVSLTEPLRSAGPLEINRLLNAYARSHDEAIGLKLLAALQEAKSLKSLRADQVKARLDQFGPKVAQQSQELLSKLNPDAAEQKKKLEEVLSSLPAGDFRRGQAIFNGAKASCFRCHTMGYVGGHVGPDLTSIGKIRTDRDLLESILFPSASFAQGFEPYVAINKSGDRFDGLLRRDDADGITLVTGPDQEVKIPRADLKELRPGKLSIMPAGLDQQMSKQELADLVAYLQAAKG